MARCRCGRQHVAWQEGAAKIKQPMCAKPKTPFHRQSFCYMEGAMHYPAKCSVFTAPESKGTLPLVGVGGMGEGGRVARAAPKAWKVCEKGQPCPSLSVFSCNYPPACWYVASGLMLFISMSRFLERARLPTRSAGKRNAPAMPQNVLRQRVTGT